ERDEYRASRVEGTTMSSTRSSVRSVGSAPPVTGDRYLRAREVCERVGLSRTTIWRQVRRGEFPTPRRLSANAIGWMASDVEAWIASRPTTRATVTPVAG